MTIRRATSADAVAVAALSAALMRAEELAAERDGAPAGHVVCTFGFDLEFADRDAWLTELYVADAHRASGVGAALVAAVEREAVACGVRALHLQVRRDNPALTRARPRSATRRTGRSSSRRP